MVEGRGHGRRKGTRQKEGDMVEVMSILTLANDILIASFAEIFPSTYTCTATLSLFLPELYTTHTECCTDKRYQGIPGNTREYQGIPGNTREYQGIPGNTREYQGIPGNTREY